MKEVDGDPPLGFFDHHNISYFARAVVVEDNVIWSEVASQNSLDHLALNGRWVLFLALRFPSNVDGTPVPHCNLVRVESCPLVPAWQLKKLVEHKEVAVCKVNNWRIKIEPVCKRLTSIANLRIRRRTSNLAKDGGGLRNSDLERGSLRLGDDVKQKRPILDIAGNLDVALEER